MRKKISKPGWVPVLFLLVSLGTGFNACQHSNVPAQPIASSMANSCMEELTRVIVRDVVAPPVAGRMYAYCALAYFEAVRFADSSTASITAQLKGFDAIPAPQNKQHIEYGLAGLESFCTVAREMVFSKDSINRFYEASIRQLTAGLSVEVSQASLQHGRAVAAVILKRLRNDHYKDTRGMPRYTVFRETGRWMPTAPDYADALEPYWGTLQPLLMDSAGACAPAPAPAYQIADTSGIYYRELMETYLAVKNRTPAQDSIARYWDDNAFVTEHKGHLVYATKKTTPCGHWIGITGILCGKASLNDVQTARVYALTAAAMHDGFISCWHEKFSSRMVRPITVIRETKDPEWWPILQTPPFPEYTSGHSVISAAANEVLENEFGKTCAFTDTTEMPYLGVQRSYTSIHEAQEEAGISRLYGGIHYRSAIVQGKMQGEKVGTLFRKLKK